jgi:predicted transglutaminase-like cysteine proteinase
MISRKLIILLFILSVLFGGAIDAVAGTSMATGAPVVPPAGFIGFCVKHPEMCLGAEAAPAAPVKLTWRHARELEDVQMRVNGRVAPRAMPANAWDYPTDGTGDCNRYALEKQRELLELGWPRDALLLTVAITERGEGHLVLVATTDEGDFVLDNRYPRVRPWEAMPYRWIARQSRVQAAAWVGLAGAPVQVAETR